MTGESAGDDQNFNEYLFMLCKYFGKLFSCIIMANVTSLNQRLAQFICAHRRAWPFRWLGQISYLVWRAYENRNFEMETNGEIWCLKQLTQLNPKCIFDVGANVGDYLERCRQFFPVADIHAFEIAPPVFSKLQEKFANRTRVTLNSFGLSDQNSEIEIFYQEKSDYKTTAYKEHFDPAYQLPGQKASSLQVISARVIRGDDYVAERGIQFIDLLKIDVEGMEKSVLEGFHKMFSQHRIRLVQFEYNTTNIVSGFLLRDAYHFFNSVGYRIGKLYPNYVEFRDYHYRHEDFCGPNMIAVRKEDEEILHLLVHGNKMTR